MKPLEGRLRIRPAGSGDIDEIVKLYDAVIEHLESTVNYPGWKKGVYPAKPDAVAATESSALYIALLGSTPVGSIVLDNIPEAGYKGIKWQSQEIMEGCAYKNILVLRTLVVHPSYWGRGIARSLMEFAEETALYRNCDAIRLDVVKGNLPAIQLYEKCGYSHITTGSLGYEKYGLPLFEMYEKVLKR
ncbi:MAG: GNAT family N-acetyltransferase [Peptostreptococcaceae bacterium]|nr:GNAT family N-acetyltransferase [Peptostreptococcaceae bacterium]